MDRRSFVKSTGGAGLYLASGLAGSLAAGCSWLTGPSEEQEQIAFWSNRDEGTGELYLGDLQEEGEGNYTGLTDIKRLTNNKHNDIWPTWSPDGKSLLWSANRPTSDGWFALYKMNPDSENLSPTRITPHIDGFSVYYAIWGNDGNIYANFRDRTAETQGILRVSPNGSGLDKIVERPFLGWLSGRPTISPDGSRLAFKDKVGRNMDIFSIKIGEVGIDRLTESPAKDLLPYWLPDGRILFVSDRANPNQTPIESDVWVMDYDGENKTRLTFSEGRELDLTISSDGEHIFFTYDDGTFNSQIYTSQLARIANKENWTLLTSKGENVYPSPRPKHPQQSF